jgi:hypothetical protein
MTHLPFLGVSAAGFQRLPFFIARARIALRQKKRRSPRGPRRSSAAKQLHRSVHPLDLGHARGVACAHPSRHPGQYEVRTNDEPRYQPSRQETRPDQRLYVPLGSPPSVAVSSSSARAAHRSSAPQIYSLRMNSNAAPVKTSKSEKPCSPGIVVPVRPIELAGQHAAALKIYGQIRTGTDHCDRVSLAVLWYRPQREYRASHGFRTESPFDVFY